MDCNVGNKFVKVGTRVLNRRGVKGRFGENFVRAFGILHKDTDRIWVACGWLLCRADIFSAFLLNKQKVSNIFKINQCEREKKLILMTLMLTFAVAGGRFQY